MSDRSAAHLHTPHVVAKRTATLRKRWADPEQKRVLVERCGFQSEKSRLARAAAMARPEVRAKVAMSVLKPSYRVRRALNPPKFRPESIARWIEICKTRPHTAEERAKKEATRTRSMAARRSHQVRILTEMALPHDCRDVARIREVLASGVYVHDLALWIGACPNAVRKWMRGIARPKAVRNDGGQT